MAETRAKAALGCRPRRDLTTAYRKGFILHHVQGASWTRFAAFAPFGPATLALLFQVSTAQYN